MQTQALTPWLNVAAVDSCASPEDNSCTLVLSKLHSDVVTERLDNVHCLPELLLVSTKGLEVVHVEQMAHLSSVAYLIP